MYNVELYVIKALLCLRDQGLNEEEFEIIVIDDGSIDKSLLAAKNTTIGWKNVTVISQENRGLGGARNTGIKSAKGDYIIFLDADDWFVPQGLSVLIRVLNQYKLDVLEFGAQGIFPDGSVKYSIAKKSESILNGIEYVRSVKYLHSACNKVYSRFFLESQELLFTEGIYIEDFEFNTRVFALAENVLATDFIVAQFLQSPNSITRSISEVAKVKRVNDLILVLEKTLNFYVANDFLNSKFSESYFTERLTFLNVSIFYQLFKNRDDFKSFRDMRNTLRSRRLLALDFKLEDKRKNLFRILLLNFFSFFRIILPASKYLLPTYKFE